MDDPDTFYREVGLVRLCQSLDRDHETERDEEIVLTRESHEADFARTPAEDVIRRYVTLKNRILLVLATHHAGSVKRIPKDVLLDGLCDDIRLIDRALNELTGANLLRDLNHSAGMRLTSIGQTVAEALSSTDPGSPLDLAIAGDKIFEYFEPIRKIIAAAEHDIFFVDRYLDAGFVARYLPQIRLGVRIRLLAREGIGTLLPAAQVFAAQSRALIEIRSAQDFHDRFVFIDGTIGYQSGSSFKDGGKTAPTTFRQLTDSFASMFEEHELIWKSGKIKLPIPLDPEG